MKTGNKIIITEVNSDNWKLKVGDIGEIIKSSKIFITAIFPNRHSPYLLTTMSKNIKFELLRNMNLKNLLNTL